MARLKLFDSVAKASVGTKMTVRNTSAKDSPVILAADGTPATLSLMGADSPTARRLAFSRKAAAQSKAYVAWSNTEKADLVTADDIAQQEREELDYIVDLTVNWHGFEGDDDEPLPFSKEAARTLYEASPMIREQALAFVAERKNFFGH